MERVDGDYDVSFDSWRIRGVDKKSGKQVSQTIKISLRMSANGCVCVTL